jgi:hypothetical protein
MVERTLHPEWRAEQETTKYPFGSNASLANDENDVILEGVFLDAILYPIGSTARVFLSQVEITHDSVELTLADPVTTLLASASFDLLDPPSRVVFTDPLGRPAGMLVSEPSRLVSFQSWTVGTHLFDIEQTEFAATVVVPTPEIGLRGIQLEDGSLFTGQIWIVGDDGVVVRSEPTTVPGKCGEDDVDLSVIRVDIVGDPLFRRRLCTADDLFVTPRFLKTISIDDGKQVVRCGPDENGDFKLTVNNALAEDTILRIRPSEDGLVIEAVGSTLQSVR